MDHLLLLLLLLWSSGLHTEGKPNSEEPFRLVGGDSHCAGTLEFNHQGVWGPVGQPVWTLNEVSGVCKDLDCGSAVSVREKREHSLRSVWKIKPNCVQSGSALRYCATSGASFYIMDLTCSDSVRLVGGTSLCSGRLEVKSDQQWSSVCEHDFDLQDAEVVCRELGCGAPSVLQGALYGETEAPTWTKEFQCEGNESALLDCRSSDSARNTCSPGKAVGLTCSEPFRLVGGDSRCAGTLEMKHQGVWGPVGQPVRTVKEASVWKIKPDCVQSGSALWDCGHWRLVGQPVRTLKDAAVVCKTLGCGSVVSVGRREESSHRSAWWLWSYCIQSGSGLRNCATAGASSSVLYLTCSDPTVLIIRVIVPLLTLLLLNTALYFYCKASRGQKSGTRENIELDYVNLGELDYVNSGVPAAEGGPTEEEGAQAAE